MVLCGEIQIVVSLFQYFITRVLELTAKNGI